MQRLPCRQSSSRQSSLDLVDDARKSGHIVHGDVAEHFAVDFDVGLLQTIGKLAVGHTALARCRIDTPEEMQYYKHGGILPYVLRSLIGK